MTSNFIHSIITTKTCYPAENDRLPSRKVTKKEFENIQKKKQSNHKLQKTDTTQNKNQKNKNVILQLTMDYYY